MGVTSSHLRVHGRVQAVGYRRWAVATAKELQLNGWVRNCKDGTVEMVISGDTASVLAMRKACERGPQLSHVTRVDVSPWAEPVPEKFKQVESV